MSVLSAIRSVGLPALSFLALARVVAAQAVYSVSDLGVLPGYEYAIANNAGARVINNAGQVIFQCVHTVNVGDPSQQILPDAQTVAVRYSPTVGLEPLALGLGQNLISPAHINEQGVVFGNSVELVWSYSSSGRLIVTRTQPSMWRQGIGSSYEALSVPESIAGLFGQVDWHQQINASGSFIVQTFDPSTGYEGGGAYLPDGWHDNATLDASLVPGSITISAINDSGMMVGWVDSTPDFAWAYSPAGGLTQLIIPNDYGTGATARFISNAGDIVGDFLTPSQPGDSQPFRRHAYIKRTGQTPVDFHLDARGTDSYVGQMSWPYVAGSYFDIDSSNFQEVGTFRFNALTGQQDFVPPDPFEISGGPVAINASGQIVGNARLDIDPFSPWISRSGSQREYLRDLIGDPNEQQWVLKWVLDINDRGQIAVYARRVSDGRASVIVLNPVCQADFDGSGEVTVQDIFAYLSAWFAGDPRTDLDGNGISVQDIFLFLNAWFAGCR